MMQRLRLGFAVVAALTVIGLRADSQTNADTVRFSATLINMEAPAGSVATPVDILLERWSSDQERDQVMNAMLEGTSDKLLDVVRKLPRIGSIHTPGSLGWDLRYARHGAGTDGRDRITILTDRPISFFEARERPRSADYPFTVIELRIGSDGRGEGQMMLGTKITMDRATGTLIMENYNIQQLSLNNVRREK
jgi:hypothetical protein